MITEPVPPRQWLAMLVSKVAALAVSAAAILYVAVVCLAEALKLVNAQQSLSAVALAVSFMLLSLGLPSGAKTLERAFMSALQLRKPD